MLLRKYGLEEAEEEESGSAAAWKRKIENRTGKTGKKRWTGKVASYGIRRLKKSMGWRNT